MCDLEKTFKFSESDYVYTTSWQEPLNLTEFDSCINSYWDNAMANGYFKFKLNIQKRRQLKGRFKMIAQLNIERAIKKREAQSIQTMDDPFDPGTFNFTHIPNKEVIFKMINKNDDNRGNSPADLLVVNVSPLAPSHCLLLPQVDKTLPQVFTFHAAKLALQSLLLSCTPSFRIGFNSLCGFASVNHLHLHTFLIPQKMILETIPLEHLAGTCYTVSQYAIKGFAFERVLKCTGDIDALAGDTYKLTSFLQDQKIAHNVNFTRSGDTDKESERAKVRVYIWPREYSGDEEMFDVATEESVCEILDKLTRRCYENVQASVRELFGGRTT